MAAAGSHCVKSSACAPSDDAMARRAGMPSTAHTLEAPRCCAAMIARSPTGPHPTTATSHPGPTPPFSAQKKAVDRMSPSSTPSSSLTPSGILASVESASGTRTYSACAPCSPTRASAGRPSSASLTQPNRRACVWLQRQVKPRAQKVHSPQLAVKGHMTRSPTASLDTLLPAATMVPTNSWPVTQPFAIPFSLSWNGWRSLPQMPARCTLTSTSVGCMTLGVGTVLSSIACLPANVNACMVGGTWVVGSAMALNSYDLN
mmetsp:Transcript_7555/g.18735  ORF Transcript_7555/g.18735 Transcript_7555/m.18735 type:complete len:260 (+) Transcript_7555:1682-2461(+)